MTEVIADVEAGVARLAEALIEAGPDGTMVLSGAGLSTESGIPDYRGATGRARPATPMTFQEFTGHAEARQRYWARSHQGWGLIARAQANAGHQAVADLQRQGVLSGIVTQNVDGLHQAGGAGAVIELHGTLDRVICLDCRAVTGRAELDARLEAANPSLTALRSSAEADLDIKPDGDVDLAEEAVRSFVTVGCLDCDGGMLKPDVVFFGENVPPERVAASYALVHQSRLLVVLGSSLTVASGLRFVRRAAAHGITVIIANQGETRGDPVAAARIDAPLGAVLGGVAASCSQAIERREAS